MEVLITGGAGFIGSHAAEHLLSQGNSVTILDDFNSFYDPAIKRSNIQSLLGKARVEEADIRNAEAVLQIVRSCKPDAILHLAARAGVRPSIREPELYIDTNIKGTFNLLEAARLVGVPRFISASSSSVYGTLKTAPFREDMCLNQTISPYAATKLAAEQLCSNFSHLYGMRCINLRFFTVYGPRQRPDLAIHSFTRAIHEGRSIQQFGDGSTRRDYTYIDDILQGILACFDYDGPMCDVFNLGESQTTTLAELIASIESALGKRAMIEKLPDQPGDVPLTYAYISMDRDLLNYRPHTQIAQGIPKFVDWFLESQKTR
jgi:UDP-glucuronate 4-epimerase